MANAKVIEAMIRRRGSNLMPKEETKVIVRKRITKKPWEGLTPGTKAWMKVWKEHPECQREMSNYTLTKGEDTMADIEEERKKREIERKAVERYVREHGVQTKRGRGEEEDDDDPEEEEERPPKRNHRAVIIKKEVEMEEEDVTAEEIMSMSRRTLIKFADLNKVDVDDLDEYDDLDELKKAVIDWLIENDYLEEETPKPKKIVRSRKEEVMNMTRKTPFDGPRTFDVHAVALPIDVKTVKQLKEWMREDNRTIIEFKDGKLKAYNPTRVTASGRVAKVTVKKQGNNHIVSYRSNKNSRVVDNDEE